MRIERSAHALPYRLSPRFSEPSESPYGSGCHGSERLRLVTACFLQYSPVVKRNTAAAAAPCLTGTCGVRAVLVSVLLYYVLHFLLMELEAPSNVCVYTSLSITGIYTSQLSCSPQRGLCEGIARSPTAPGSWGQLEGPCGPQ